MTPNKSETPRLGKIKPPYPVDRCASTACHVRLSEQKGGAYLFKDLESDKLVVLCEDCTMLVEIRHDHRFKLIAL